MNWMHRLIWLVTPNEEYSIRRPMIALMVLNWTLAFFAATMITSTSPRNQNIVIPIALLSLFVSIGTALVIPDGVGLFPGHMRIINRIDRDVLKFALMGAVLLQALLLATAYVIMALFP